MGFKKGGEPKKKKGKPVLLGDQVALADHLHDEFPELLLLRRHHATGEGEITVFTLLALEDSGGRNIKISMRDSVGTSRGIICSPTTP